MNDDITIPLVGVGLAALYFATKSSVKTMHYDHDAVKQTTASQRSASVTRDPRASSPGISLGWAPAPRPSFDAGQWERRKPTPGAFFAVPKGRTIQSIAGAALRSFVEICCQIHKVPKADRTGWIDDMATNHNAIRQATDSIQTGWNDEAYGSPCVEVTGPHGRGLDLRPVHDDVRGQLERGQTPRRNLSATGDPTKSGTRSRPYVWIPKWDTAAFMAGIKRGEIDLTCQRDPWGDRSTGHWPPPCVTERGFILGSNR